MTKQAIELLIVGIVVGLVFVFAVELLKHC